MKVDKMPLLLLGIGIVVFVAWFSPKMPWNTSEEVLEATPDSLAEIREAIHRSHSSPADTGHVPPKYYIEPDSLYLWWDDEVPCVAERARADSLEALLQVYMTQPRYLLKYNVGYERICELSPEMQLVQVILEAYLQKMAEEPIVEYAPYLPKYRNAGMEW